MKKHLFTLLASIVVYLGVVAQQAPDIFLKWAPTSLAAGKITVGGEFNFKKKNSVELFIGIPTPITRQFEYDGEKNDMKSKAFSILGGYRRYLGKKPSSGFYLEPFVKYLKHETSGILEGSLNGTVSRFNTTTTYKGFGGGIQLGVQFIIAKRISLDLFFLGPEANSSTFTSTSKDIANNLPWTFAQANEARDEMEDAVRDLPIIGDKIEVTVNQSQKTVGTKYEGFLPGIRFGTSIGIRL